MVVLLVVSVVYVMCLVDMVWLCMVFIYLFCFFKQKTAYEMRISDWSSDVCSSDLVGAFQRAGADRAEQAAIAGAQHRRTAGIGGGPVGVAALAQPFLAVEGGDGGRAQIDGGPVGVDAGDLAFCRHAHAGELVAGAAVGRSEEGGVGKGCGGAGG